MWMGNLRFETPMLFVTGALIIFLTGGLTGPPLGIVATDLQLTDTYFVVGHFHATMFGGYIFPFFAALYYWFPKATGRRMNENLGKLHFWLMFPSFLVMSLGTDVDRSARHAPPHRRLRPGPGHRHRPPDRHHCRLYHRALGADLTLSTFIRSVRRGEVATGNVWESRSPEWQIPSPAPMHNYPVPVRVVGEPYDYGVPGSRYVDVGSPVPVTQAGD